MAARRFLCHHVDRHLASVLPEGWTVRSFLGQYPRIRCPEGHRYLAEDAGTHFLLHRRVSPHSEVAARNAIEEMGPPLGVLKPDTPAYGGNL